MKRLLVAVVAAVAFSAAFAKYNDPELFEDNSYTNVFKVYSSQGEDSSAIVPYDNDKPGVEVAQPYPCDDDFGNAYLSLDTGSDALWCSNTFTGNVYFDMVMQFNLSNVAPTVGEGGTKVAIYMNSDSNLVVVAGDGSEDRVNTDYTIDDAELAPGTWGRLTIASETTDDGLFFKIYLNGVQLASGGTNSFQCLTGDTTITQFGLAGSGAIDDFVVRTTNPFIQNPAVQVGGEGYASLADAISDAGIDSTFELLANNAEAVTLGEGESLKLKQGEFAYTGTITVPDGYVVGTPTTVEGVTTYAQVEGVAKVYGDDDAWKWFASFADAFTYARAQSYQPKMTFKVGSDFTPDISSDFGVWMLEFVATTEDPITINLANGNAKLVSAYITFPTTATLNAVSGSVSSMKGGTLNVPSGVVLELASYATDGTSWNITGLSGSGTIKNDGKSMYYFLGNTQYNLPTRMRESSWCGTLELCGSNDWEAEFNKFANANSKVRFNGLTTTLYGSGNDTVAIELVGDGLTITGAYESARTYTIGGAITGSGALTLSDNTGSVLISGDVSGFTGNVTAAGTSSAITFGNAMTGSGQRIVVGGGESVTNAVGATWTATNLVLLGELTVNGTLAVNDGCIWCNNGNGVLRYTNKDTLPTSKKVAGSWNSKCIIACDPGNKRFVLNDFGNANSTLEIVGDNGVFSALPSTANSGGTAPSINPAVILTANWTISDGWHGTDYTTTFSKLSGSGNLTVNGTSYTNPIYYTITELDGYTGTLGGRRGNFTIGKVNVATQPDEGKRVVKTNIGTYGSINDNVPLYVAGGDTGKTLKYDAKGTDDEGLYLPVPVTTVNITVPAIANATATVTTNGVAVAASGAGTSYTVDAGAEVVITYAADAGYVLSGQSEYTIASATEGATIDVSGTSTAVEVAAVYRNDEKIAGYASLRAAVEAATAGDTVKLIADDHASFSMDNLEVAIGKAITIDGNGFTVYGVSDYAGGAGDHDIYISGSGDVTIKNVTLAGFAGSVANNMRTYPIWTGSAYSGTLTLDNVMVENFNRTAFNLNGGTVLVTNCTITCDNTKATDFQEGIGVYLANVTIVDTTITGAGSLDENWPKAACIQLGNPNGTVPGTGTITVLGGSFAGQYGIIVASNAQNNVSVQGGSFTGSLDVEEGEAGTISITGGTFSVDPTEFCAAGYAADEVSADIWEVSAAYTVTYELGLVGATNAVDNIERYTANTPEFTLLPAGCEGYEFVEWTNSVGAVETIAGGATGDITLYASWNQVQKHNAGESINCDSAEEAADLAAAITTSPEDYINVPSGVSDGSAYCGLFKGVVDGTSVMIVLTEEAVSDIKEDIDDAAATIPLSALAAGTSLGTQVTVDVVPGIWYSVSQGSSLTTMQEGDRFLATDADEGTMTFLLSHQDAAGFYKVNANVADKEPVPPNP